ncbi:glycosyltransferase [Aestuariimicrobium soli]|uniref:glycosyltransferase n=1 Tax=Aestuariimicrobium soli TaxID=2035834 RepID=UPI003EB84F90
MSADRPGVTVVVVAYNHREHVEEALASVLAQTLPPARVLVIDDASPDGTSEVVRAWCAEHAPTWELDLHDHNLGLCAGLNRALATIDTPLYAYLSGDDLMRPDRLSRQVNAWVDDGRRAALVYSDARVIDERGDVIAPSLRTVHGWPEPASGRVVTDLVVWNWIVAASVLLVTDRVRQVGGYDERWFYEDHDLWLRLAARHPVLAVDDPLVSFRQLATSLGSTRLTDLDPDHLGARVAMLTKLFGIDADLDEALRRHVPPRAIQLWRTGAHPEVAREGFTKAAAGRAAPNLRLRALLIGLGVRREPEVFSRVSRVAARLRSGRSGQ